MKYEQESLMKRKLSKDIVNKKLSGVCSGLARYYGLPRLGVRLATIVAMFVFPVVVGAGYVVATLLMPER